MKKPIKLATLVFITTFNGMAYAQSRDPFAPYTTSAPVGADAAANSKGGSDAAPLVNKPLSSYTVIGVVVSPSDAIAVLKSRDKHEYFAYIGDKVGLEGGVISTINSEGITVDISGKVVPLKVSNRFENTDETQPETK